MKYEIARLVKEGYICGQKWELDVPDENVREDEGAMFTISELIEQGFTSGYYPTWTLTTHK